MKPFLIGLVFSVVAMTTSAQCPTEPLVLGSQDAIDNFSTNYPNCTEVNVPVFIDEIDGPIDNLNGLIQLLYIESLNIQYTHLEDFSGLNNLNQMNEFRLFRNNFLLNFNGLESLTEVESFNVIQNNALNTSQGLDNLVLVDYFNLYENAMLSDLNSFSGITELISFRVSANNFNTLSGFENLSTVSNELFISGENLTNISELSNVFNSFTGSLYFVNNAQLEDLSALTNLTNVENLILVGSESLTDLTGFENLSQVNDLLRIGFNPQLESLEVLSGLVSVGNLDIYENENLTSLTGLESLEVIGENFYLMDNPNLTEINALQNVNPQGLQQVVISRNTSLSTCDNDFVCQVIFDPEISEEIQANANGCNSVPQVAARCILEVPQAKSLPTLDLWPSPANQGLNVLAGGAFIRALDVYNVQGELIDTVRYTADQTLSQAELNVSAYASGLYFISINTDRGLVHSKFIKR